MVKTNVININSLPQKYRKTVWGKREEERTNECKFHQLPIWSSPEGSSQFEFNTIRWKEEKRSAVCSRELLSWQLELSCNVPSQKWIDIRLDSVIWSYRTTKIFLHAPECQECKHGALSGCNEERGTCGGRGRPKLGDSVEKGQASAIRGPRRTFDMDDFPGSSARRESHLVCLCALSSKCLISARHGGATVYVVSGAATVWCAGWAGSGACQWHGDIASTREGHLPRTTPQHPPATCGFLHFLYDPRLVGPGLERSCIEPCIANWYLGRCRNPRWDLLVSFLVTCSSCISS